jgi:hypothetical protein
MHGDHKYNAFFFDKYCHRIGVFLIGDQHQITGCWSVNRRNILCRCCCSHNALCVKSYVLCQLCYMYMWIVVGCERRGRRERLRGKGRGKKVASALVLACEGIRYTTRVIDCMKVGLAYTSWHMSILTFVRYTESPSVLPSVRLLRLRLCLVAHNLKRTQCDLKMQSYNITENYIKKQ